MYVCAGVKAEVVCHSDDGVHEACLKLEKLCMRKKVRVFDR